jgi:hypothetical protein
LLPIVQALFASRAISVNNSAETCDQLWAS